MRACERLMKQTKSKPDAGDAGDKGSKQLVAENKAKADSTAAESGPANANPHGVGAAYRTSMLGTKSKQGQGPAAANPPNKQQVLLRGSKARTTKQKPSARFEWLFSKVSIETKILVFLLILDAQVIVVRARGSPETVCEDSLRRSRAERKRVGAGTLCSFLACHSHCNAKNVGKGVL